MIKTSYILKNRIKNSFSKSAKTYNNWAIPQDEVAKKLISFSNINLNGNAVDIGCGTGLITNCLMKRFTSLNITGIDISTKMLSHYEHINPNSIHCDMELLPFVDNCFNHSFSSFSLHWTNIKKSLSEMIRITSDYIFIAIPINGSIPEFRFPFPNAHDLYDIIGQFNLKVIVDKTIKVKIPFSGIDLIKYFHYTGTTVNPSKDNYTKCKLDELANRCKNKNFEYIVLFLVLKKI